MSCCSADETREFRLRSRDSGADGIAALADRAERAVDERARHPVADGDPDRGRLPFVDRRRLILESTPITADQCDSSCRIGRLRMAVSDPDGSALSGRHVSIAIPGQRAAVGADG